MHFLLNQIYDQSSCSPHQLELLVFVKVKKRKSNDSITYRTIHGTEVVFRQGDRCPDMYEIDPPDDFYEGLENPPKLGIERKMKVRMMKKVILMTKRKLNVRKRKGKSDTKRTKWLISSP